MVTPPTIKLSVKPITNASPAAELLVGGRDYNVRVYQLGLFQPGQYRRVGYSIELLNPNLLGTTLNYVVQWTATTDSVALTTAARILGKQVSSSELQDLSTSASSLVGTIVYAR